MVWVKTRRRMGSKVAAMQYTPLIKVIYLVLIFQDDVELLGRPIGISLELNIKLIKILKIKTVIMNLLISKTSRM